MMYVLGRWDAPHAPYSYVETASESAAVSIAKTRQRKGKKGPGSLVFVGSAPLARGRSSPPPTGLCATVDRAVRVTIDRPCHRMTRQRAGATMIHDHIQRRGWTANGE